MLVRVVRNLEIACKGLNEKNPHDAILVTGCTNCTTVLIVIEGAYSAVLHEIGMKVKGDIFFRPIYHTSYCFFAELEEVKKIIRETYPQVKFEETASA